MRVKVKPPQSGLQVENNGIKPISPSFNQIVGPSHAGGGVDVTYNGQKIEAQGGEPQTVDQQGSAVFFGKMKDLQTGKTFERQAKDLAEQENKATKLFDKATVLVQDNNPFNSGQALTFNTGKVLNDSAAQQYKQIQQEKEALGQRQQMQLNYAEATGQDPQKLKKAQFGTSLFGQQPSNNTFNFLPQPLSYQNPTLPPVPNSVPVPSSQTDVNEWLRTSPNIPGNEGYTTDKNKPTVADATYVQHSLESAAQQVGVDPNLLRRLSYQESDFRPGVKGAPTKYGTAYGHVQMLPSTAKQYGLTQAQLKSKKPEDVDAVSVAGAKHLQSLLNQYNGDQALALIAYNGGPKAIQDTRKSLGKADATGQDILNYWQQQNEKNPSKDSSLWRNQTYNYAKNILDTPDQDFYGGSGTGTSYRNTYYQGAEGTKPNVRPIYSNETPEQAAINQGIQPSTYTSTDSRNFIEDPINSLQPLLPGNQQSTNPNQRVRIKAPQNTLTPLDYLPEIGAILDRPDYVQGQQFRPQLMDSYRVSNQNAINQNQAGFNTLARAYNNNPQALSILAGQLYQQNQNALSQEFQANQGIANQVANQNVQLLNQAAMTNLQLDDTLAQRQAQSKANTDANRNAALASISNKYAQNRATNQSLNFAAQRADVMQNLYNYQYDPTTGQENYFGPAAQWNFNGNPNQVVDPTQGMTDAEKKQYYDAMKAQSMFQAQQIKNANAASKSTTAKFGAMLNKKTY